MAPYARWVKESFKQTLIDSCDEYLDTNDRGNEKHRSKLITRVADEIGAIAKDKTEDVPDDLEKCVRIWFGNYAAGHAKETRPSKSKADTRGHPTSSKTWTAKSVCAHLFSDRISDEQKRLSDDGEKDISKYRAALSAVFEELSDAEVKHCEETAVQWNTQPLPDEIQRKLSKTIATEVTDFLKFMNHRTGASFIAFAAYNDEDGKQSYARYETDGQQFFSSKPEYRKGPNNIQELWRTFNLEHTEEADSEETLESDEDGYPLLPGNVLELRLSRRKAVMRQFMGAARHFHKLSGRPPWAGIADHPSQHISKRSRPDSDHKLQEPSYMKSDGVDAWLKHWLTLQKRNKRPLILKDGSDEAHPNPKSSSKRKAKASKAQATNDDESDEEEVQEERDDESDEGEAHLNPTSSSKQKSKASKPRATDDDESDEEEVEEDKNDESENTHDGDTAKGLPPTPHSASETRTGRREFLATLSKDRNYHRLLLLIRAADDGDLLDGNTPAWASWKSDAPFLPHAFYKSKSPSSLSAVMKWLSMDPITSDDNVLASYQQVELVILTVGLAFRGLWISQFPEGYSDVPTYIINSPYPFSQYEQLSHAIEDLIAGYADILRQLEAAYAKPKRSKPTPNATNDAPDGVENQDKIVGTDITGDAVTRRPGGGHRRPPGLAGVPTTLQHLREEVGLAGESWETMGVEWQALGSLWLRTDTALIRSARTDLSLTEIHQLSIPDAWKQWMFAKAMKTDAPLPSEAFGQVFTKYLRTLPASTHAIGGTVMDQAWSRPGRTGVIGLVLCLYWQAVYSGAGKDWQANFKLIERIFNAILAIPELQREKRSRAASGVAGGAASGAAGSSKRRRA